MLLQLRLSRWGGLRWGEGQSSNGAASGSNVADRRSPVGSSTLQQRAQPGFKKVRRGSGGYCLNNVEGRGVLGRGGHEVADDGGGGSGRGGVKKGHEAAGALQATMDMNAMRRASVAAQLFSGCGFGSDKRVQRCAVA